MAIIEQLERIKYIDYLIHSKTACSLEEISLKVKTSRRQVQNTITLMKNLGAPLKYCHSKKGYYYSEDKKLTIKYEKF